jgi:hypothetical protein
MPTAILKSHPGPWGDTPKVSDQSFDDSLEAERDAAIANINARTEKQKQLQVRIGQLTKAVTDAEQCLVEFNVKQEFFVERKRLLESQLPTLWGKQKGDLSTQMNFDPLLGIVESHGTILAIEAALMDTPRVKKYLDEQLRAAKQKLTEFQSSK